VTTKSQGNSGGKVGVVTGRDDCD